MASYEYNGKPYFYAMGRWVDAVSNPVKPEIASALNSIYSKEDVDAKEKAEKAKRAVPKKRIKLQSKPFSLSDKQTVSGSKYNPRFHKKAKETPYSRNVELTDDQKKALALLESGENVFLTGEAGTGKSFVLNEFLHRNRNKNILVCAPTGIAAINVGGSTLHRVFKAPIGVARPGEYNAKPDDTVVKADIVVIDEISMCRFDLFEYVIRTIKNAEAIRQNDENVDAMSNGRMPEVLKPKQIIVVGDFFQLAPVISTKDRDILYSYWDRETVGEGFAFVSPLWKELNFKNIIVREIVRQAGETDYIENLNKIRIGDFSGINWFNNNITRQPIPNGIYLCGTNQKADEINIRESEALPGQAKKYTAQVKGNVGQGDKMTMDELILKVGMQVMTLINDTNEGFQNGSIGKIASMESDHVQVRLNNGRLVTVSIHDWEILGYEIQEERLEKVVLGNFKQLPLKIAYAITIHKSQGQTYSSVNISPDCFASGQLYVALSRAKTINGMSLEHAITGGSLRTSRAVKEFYEELINSEDVFEMSQLSLFDLNDTFKEQLEAEKRRNEETPEIELIWDSENASEDDVPARRYSAYEKVMSMSEEDASSCYMYSSIRNHPSAYASWSEEEDDQLFDELRRGLKTKQIAEIHQRTEGSIRSRIKKKGYYFEEIEIGEDALPENPAESIEASEEDPVDISEVINEELFAKLKELRTRIAREESVPAFCVFTDAALAEMSVFLPKTRQELLEITGVGNSKVEKYADRFLPIILSSEHIEHPAEHSIQKENKITVAKSAGKQKKTEFYLVREDASEFVYEDSMTVGEMRDRLNTLRNEATTKRITNSIIIRFLSDEGYISEEYIDGVWKKIIKEKGRLIGIHYLTFESSIGTEYSVYGLSRQTQKLIIDHYTR